VDVIGVKRKQTVENKLDEEEQKLIAAKLGSTRKNIG